MTPERVRELAEQAGCHAGCDRDNHHLRYAIRQAVNEALEEAAKTAKERDFREYSGADSAFMEGRYDAAGEIYEAINALKLPEE